MTICLRPGGYVLTVDPDDLDVTHFHRLRNTAAALAQPEPQQAIATYRQALSLWRGNALQDAAIGQRCKAAAANLNEARLHTVEQLADLHIGGGDPARIVNDLQELVQLHPRRETLIARLMAALYGSGRSAEAVDLYMAVRKRFNDESGMEPGEALRRQYMRIIRDS